MTFPDCQTLLNDPNVFIEYSGATSDTTPYDIGMNDVVQVNSSNSTTNADGNAIKAKSVGTLKGVIGDKTGNEVGRAKIENITYLPDSKFGLISLP